MVKTWSKLGNLPIKGDGHQSNVDLDSHDDHDVSIV
jgi:hypothetical protein